MTQAKVNDRKATNTLPIMTNATYVFDRAYTIMAGTMSKCTSRATALSGA